MQRPPIHRRSTSKSSRITTSEGSSSPPVSNTSPSQMSPAPPMPPRTSLPTSSASPSSIAAPPPAPPPSPPPAPPLSWTLPPSTAPPSPAPSSRVPSTATANQQDHLATVPPLLLHLAIPTKLLAKEMSSGIVRIALECNRQRDGSRDDSGAEPPLHAVPIWSTFCNGRRFGYAVWKRPTEKDRLILKAVQSTSVGAGAIPLEDGAVMYLRARFGLVVGSSDSESYHLINPDGSGGQELGIFLLRTG